MELIKNHVDLVNSCALLTDREKAKSDIDHYNIKLIEDTGRGFLLSQSDLSGSNLSEFNLRCSILNRAQLYFANLSGANLEGVTMICAGLERTNFRNSQLVGAYLHALSAQVCDFSGTDFTNLVDATGAIFHGCKMQNAVFNNAMLAGTTFYQCDLTKASFHNTNLQGAMFNECLLNEANFEAALISQCSIIKCALTDTNFKTSHGNGFSIQLPTSCDNLSLSKARLPYLHLNGLSGNNIDAMDMEAPQLSADNIQSKGANFSGSVLENSNWVNCNLSGSNFQACSMMGCSFSNVTATEANFSGVLAENARFQLCNFSKSNMSMIKARCMMLRDCNLDAVNLKEAYLYRAMITGDPPKGMSLKNSDLSHANLVQSYLAADFSGAILKNTQLTYARLNQSIFKDAVIHGTNMYEVSAVKVDFTGSSILGLSIPLFADRCLGLQEAIESGEKEVEKKLEFLLQFNSLINKTNGSST